MDPSIAAEDTKANERNASTFQPGSPTSPQSLGDGSLPKLV